MREFVTKVKKDGRVDVPKEMIDSLGFQYGIYKVSKSGKSLIVVNGDSNDDLLTVSDGRLRLTKQQVAPLDLQPGDTVNMFCPTGARISILKG